jgi:hypothetical protein
MFESAIVLPMVSRLPSPYGDAWSALYDSLVGRSVPGRVDFACVPAGTYSNQRIYQMVQSAHPREFSTLNVPGMHKTEPRSSTEVEHCIRAALQVASAISRPRRNQRVFNAPNGRFGEYRFA